MFVTILAIALLVMMHLPVRVSREITIQTSGVAEIVLVCSAQYHCSYGLISILQGLHLQSVFPRLIKMRRDHIHILQRTPPIEPILP